MSGEFERLLRFYEIVKSRKATGYRFRDGVIAGTFALAGCATVPATLTTEVRTVEVVKPVPVACIKAAEIPPKSPTAMPAPEADVGAKAAGASADVRQLENENAQLRAALLACATIGDPKP